MRIFLNALLLAVMNIANASEKMSINVDINQPKFVVSLAANATTGYQWSVQSYDKTILKLHHSKYITPKTHLIGAGGKMEFTFILANHNRIYPKNTVISFKYARPWESDKGVTKKVTVIFHSPQSVKK